MHRRNILLFAVLYYSPRRFDIDRHAILQRCEKKKRKEEKRVVDRDRNTLHSEISIFARNFIWPLEMRLTRGVAPTSNVRIFLSFFLFVLLCVLLFISFLYRSLQRFYAIVCIQKRRSDYIFR